MDVMENWRPLGWRQRTSLLMTQWAAQACLCDILLSLKSQGEVRGAVMPRGPDRCCMETEFASGLVKLEFRETNLLEWLHANPLDLCPGEDIAFILWGQIHLPFAPEGDSSFQVCLFYKHLWKDSWCLGTSLVVQWLRRGVSRADAVGSIPGAESSACCMVQRKKKKKRKKNWVPLLMGYAETLGTHGELFPNTTECHSLRNLCSVRHWMTKTMLPHGNHW